MSVWYWAWKYLLGGYLEQGEDHVAITEPLSTSNLSTDISAFSAILSKQFSQINEN